MLHDVQAKCSSSLTADGLTRKYVRYRYPLQVVCENMSTLAAQFQTSPYQLLSTCTPRWPSCAEVSWSYAVSHHFYYVMKMLYSQVYCCCEPKHPTCQDKQSKCWTQVVASLVSSPYETRLQSHYVTRIYVTGQMSYLTFGRDVELSARAHNETEGGRTCNSKNLLNQQDLLCELNIEAF